MSLKLSSIALYNDNDLWKLSENMTA